MQDQTKKQRLQNSIATKCHFHLGDHEVSLPATLWCLHRKRDAVKFMSSIGSHSEGSICSRGSKVKNRALSHIELQTIQQLAGASGKVPGRLTLTGR
jgi:hypothetical protein